MHTHKFYCMVFTAQTHACIVCYSCSSLLPPPPAHAMKSEVLLKPQPVVADSGGHSTQDAPRGGLRLLSSMRLQLPLSKEISPQTPSASCQLGGTPKHYRAVQTTLMKVWSISLSSRQHCAMRTRAAEGPRWPLQSSCVLHLLHSFSSFILSPPYPQRPTGDGHTALPNNTGPASSGSAKYCSSRPTAKQKHHHANSQASSLI